MEIDYSSLDFDEKEMSIWDYATQVQGIVEPRNRGRGRKMRQKEKEKKNCANEKPHQSWEDD